MPPNPIAPARSVSQAWGSANRLSSRRPVASASPGQAGRRTVTSTAVTRARPAATQKAARQPTVWPSQVATGTPSTFATDSPIITVATARPSRPRGARLAATRDATPKKAPWGTPHRKREVRSRPYEPARADRALAPAYAVIRATSSPRRGSRAPKKASTGAPTTTPRAYAEIRCPACGMETPTPSATCGSRPMAMNSVVPIANPPVASASTAGLTPSRFPESVARRQPSDASAWLSVGDGRMTAVALASSGR